MLKKSELKKLRSEIVLNSLYYNDYENSLNISKYDVCNFFEGYSEYIEELMKENEKNYTDKNYWNLIQKYDNIEHLYDYYAYMFDYDPLSVTRG